MKDLILRLINIATKVTWWLAVIAAVGIALMMAINFIDVVGAKFFGVSVPGAPFNPGIHHPGNSEPLPEGIEISSEDNR